MAHTIQRFEQNTAVDAIFVIVDEDNFSECQTTVLEPYPFTKVQDLVAGGETRQMSVYNGYVHSLQMSILLLFTMACGPFVTDETIFACLTAADECGAAVVAVPVKDTIKVADENRFIVETPVRERLWAVQTPPGFSKIAVRRSTSIARKQQLTVTDDAALVEQLGFPVAVSKRKFTRI